MPSCKQCTSPFEITDTDHQFYEKIGVPEPTHCPDCRQVRRANFRNERNFYKRKCDATGKEIISMYRPETKVTVYDTKYWWSDNWEPLDHGREFDFSRPFFEQFKDLQSVVPRLSLYGKNNENSDYTNHSDQAKNSYLSVDVGLSEDIYYGKYLIHCKDMVDSYQTENASNCYEANYSPKSNNAKYVYLSIGSVDSDFLYSCRDVKDSLMCWNLRHKQYYIENKSYSKEEYEKYLENYDTGSYKNLQKYIKHYHELIKNAPRRSSEIINCEDSTGDYLHQCKNVQNTFNCYKMRDCSYCYDCAYMQDCYDTYESALDCEIQYECHACNRGKFLTACSVCYDVNNLYYCEMCHNSEYLFGCIGLRHKKYCILNKQYTKEEYEELVPKIIEHMKSTPYPSTSSRSGPEPLSGPKAGSSQGSEWGQFFPKELSFFAYNESAAPEFKQLTKSEALKQGWNWHEDKRDCQDQTYEMPDHIKNVSDGIVNETLACNKCKKNYRIIFQELAFYRNHNLPAPRLCPNCRYSKRISFRNPYNLYSRNCDNCSVGIQTTYSPGQPEKLYCESCYLKEVY